MFKPKVYGDKKTVLVFVFLSGTSNWIKKIKQTPWSESASELSVAKIENNANHEFQETKLLVLF
jgi:hypothetical protein